MSWQGFYEMEAREERQAANQARKDAMTPEDIERESEMLRERQIKNDKLVTWYIKRHPEKGKARKRDVLSLAKDEYNKIKLELDIKKIVLKSQTKEAP